MPHVSWNDNESARGDEPSIAAEARARRFPLTLRWLSVGDFVLYFPLTVMVYPGDDWVTVSSPYLDVHASAPTRKLAMELWSETVIALYEAWGRIDPHHLSRAERESYWRFRGLVLPVE